MSKAMTSRPARLLPKPTTTALGGAPTTTGRAIEAPASSVAAPGRSQAPRPATTTPAPKDRARGGAKTAGQTRTGSTPNIATSDRRTTPRPQASNTAAGGDLTADRATVVPTPKHAAPGRSAVPRPAIDATSPNAGSPGGGAGPGHANALTTPIAGPRGRSNSRPARQSAMPMAGPLGGTQPPHPAIANPAPNDQAPGAGLTSGSPPARGAPMPTAATRADFLALAFAADVVDDLERVRIAQQNRLRQLTRGGPDDERIRAAKFATVAELPPDKDGEPRGFGLSVDHPAVGTLANIVDSLSKLEAAAVRHLEKTMATQPLAGWQQSQPGIGAKQFGRLLASIGDLYIRPELVRADCDGNILDVEQSRPRSVSELWAYCGLHTVGGHAARRRKGERANWSTAAKMRAYLIAESAVRSGKTDGTVWYGVYAGRKVATVGRLHGRECVRCGPAGKPAAVGTPWSDGHRHADALRVLSKAILKGAWREAKHLHDVPAGQSAGDAQIKTAGRDPETRPGQAAGGTHTTLARAISTPTDQQPGDIQTSTVGRGRNSPHSQTLNDTHVAIAVRGDQPIGDAA